MLSPNSTSWGYAAGYGGVEELVAMVVMPALVCEKFRDGDPISACRSSCPTRMTERIKAKAAVVHNASEVLVDNGIGVSNASF